MQVVVSSRPDFRQIDVYENQPTVPRLIATNATGTSDLLTAWDGSTGATSTQIQRNNGEYWLITTPISNGQHSGFIKALVHQPQNPLPHGRALRHRIRLDPRSRSSA
jgi:hypothetical protein